MSEVNPSGVGTVIQDCCSSNFIVRNSDERDFEDVKQKIKLNVYLKKPKSYKNIPRGEKKHSQLTPV